MKKIYLCSVGGYLGKIGNQVAICGKISVGESNRCGAHGNKKCQHKAKPLTTDA